MRYNKIKEVYDIIKGIANTITGIETVVFGSLINIGRLRTPILWIIPDTVNIITTGTGLREECEMTLHLIVLETGNADERDDLTLKMVLDIADIYIKDRSWDEVIADVVLNSIEPVYAGAHTESVSASAVTLKITFLINL